MRVLATRRDCSRAAAIRHSYRALRVSCPRPPLSPRPLPSRAIEGHVLRGFGVKRLIDLSIAWSQQWTALGLKEPPRSDPSADPISFRPTRPKIRKTLRLERDRGRAVRTNHGPHPDAPCRKRAMHPDRRCGGHSALHCSNSSSTKACKAEKGRRPGGKLAIVRRAPSVLGLRGPQLAVSFSNGRVSMRIRTLQLSASSVKRPPTGSPVVGPPSPAGIPSVGDDDRAGHEARCVGGEEQNDGGDLVDFAHARYRRVVHPSIEQRLRIGGEPGLVGQAEDDHSAHPGLRQIQPNRWQVLPAPALPSTPNTTVTPARPAKS